MPCPAQRLFNRKISLSTDRFWPSDLCPPFCLSVCLFACLFVNKEQTVFVDKYLNKAMKCFFVHLQFLSFFLVHFSAHSSLFLCIYCLALRLSLVCLYVCLSVCLFVCLFVCLSVCLFLCLSVRSALVSVLVPAIFCCIKSQQTADPPASLSSNSGSILDLALFSRISCS